MQKQSTGGLRSATWLEWLRNLLLLVLAGAYTELALHVCVFHGVGLHIIYPLLFGTAVGAVIALIVSLLPVWPGRIVAVVLMSAFVFWAEVQLVYHAIFGNFLSLSMIGLGNGVFESFSAQLRYAIGRNLFSIFLLLLPVIVLLVMCVIRRAFSFRMRWTQRAMTLLMVVVIAVGSVELMVLTRGETVSALKLLQSQNASTDVSYQHLGMTATTVQELRFMTLGGESSQALLSGELKSDFYDPTEYNVIGRMNFVRLYDTTDDDELRALDAFFSDRVPTKKNEYTGILEGYNLITICAESFSPLFIDPELTPALYEMTHHDGFLFDNFYGTFQSVTTNGEYTFNTGLYPDMSRTKTDSSFDVAAQNYLPFCLGNALGNLGYETWGYHNYIGHFYNRYITHPNMGYTFRTPDNGLNITIQSPSSDMEMIDASVGDYINSKKPFHAYYMTYSGHYQYNWDNNMSAKNRDKVEGLYESETVQAFVACNLELEYALEHLLADLEEAGKLDTTCIVLTNDHYPYGLSEAEYNELAGKPIDTTFERYRNCFICYAPGLHKDIHVDAYCSTADILPTILNLFGVEYDSRLLAGVDVLSDAEHIAVLSDESFLTSDFRYDAATGRVIPADPNEEIDSTVIKRIQDEISARFSFSAEILNHDYYAHALQLLESELPDQEEEVVPFEDLKKDDTKYGIYYQAAVIYLYERGYVEPISETMFGMEEDEILGNFTRVLYRMADSPKTGAAALPEDYDIAADSPYYEAVCWAFQNGILKADDAVTDPEAAVGYRTAALLIYRYALLHGLAEAPDITELQRRYASIPEEVLQAEQWCFDSTIISATFSAEALVSLEDETLTRARSAMYLARICMRESGDGS